MGTEVCIGNICCTLPGLAPPLSWHVGSNSEEIKSWLLRKRRVEHVCNIFAFCGAAWDTSFCLTWLRVPIKMAAYFACQVTGSWEQRQVSWLVTAPEILQYPKKTPGGGKDYPLLRKDRGKSLWLGNYTHTHTTPPPPPPPLLEKKYPQKSCERFPESLVRMTGEGLPL